jgi:hypothetical protein
MTAHSRNDKGLGSVLLNIVHHFSGDGGDIGDPPAAHRNGYARAGFDQPRASAEFPMCGCGCIGQVLIAELLPDLDQKRIHNPFTLFMGLPAKKARTFLTANSIDFRLASWLDRAMCGAM